MSLHPCSACGGHIQGKAISVYWAWNRADGTRVSYLSWLDQQHFLEHVMPWDQGDAPAAYVCPGCGIGTVDDYDAIYAHIYVPRMPEMVQEWPTCASCAAVKRLWIVDHSALQPDRQAQLGAGAPNTPSTPYTWEEWRRSMGRGN